MFLILLSFIAVGLESQIFVDQVTLYSNNVKGILRCLFYLGEHAQKPKFGDKVQFLESFISFYFEKLSYLACGEKIIRLAFKNSVKLGKKSASDF